MTKRTALCYAVALFAFMGCKDRKLTDDLQWMNNTYNPHEGISMAVGHGRTGWYNQGANGTGDVLWLGTIDTFKNDGCNFELHIEDDPSGQVNTEMVGTTILRFNLRDIDPESVAVKTFSHYGGFDCGEYTADEISSMNMRCDFAELNASTRNAEPLVQEEHHTIFPKLTGKDHESSDRRMGTKVFFGIDDPEYATKFAGVFRDTVKRCGGTRGAAN